MLARGARVHYAVRMPPIWPRAGLGPTAVPLFFFALAVSSAPINTLAAGRPLAKLKVAVFDVEARGIPTEQVPVLTEVLTTHLAAGAQLEVIAGRDLAAILDYEAQKQLLGCDDSSCFAELGGAIGADKLVVAQVGKLGDTYVVNIKMIDVRNIRIDARVSENVTGGLGKVISAIERAAGVMVEATAPRPFLGVGKAPAALWAGGLVAVGVGVGFGLKAKTHYNHAIAPGYVGAQLEIDRGETSQRVANVSLAAGALSVVSGLVVWWLNRPADPLTTAAGDHEPGWLVFTF